jgi:phosphodiesterase/alkaline phosphatase D-like protein
MSLLGCGRTSLHAEDAEPVADHAFESLAALPEDRGTFPLGVSAGAMQDDQVTLWTRCLVGDRLTLHVFAERDGPTDLESIGALALPVSASGFVHVRLQGVVPGAHHRFAFRTARSRSAD